MSYITVNNKKIKLSFPLSIIGFVIGVTTLSRFPYGRIHKNKFCEPKKDICLLLTSIKNIVVGWYLLHIPYFEIPVIGVIILFTGICEWSMKDILSSGLRVWSFIGLVLAYFHYHPPLYFPVYFGFDTGKYFIDICVGIACFITIIRVLNVIIWSYTEFVINKYKIFDTNTND